MKKGKISTSELLATASPLSLTLNWNAAQSKGRLLRSELKLVPSSSNRPSSQLYTYADILDAPIVSSLDSETLHMQQLLQIASERLVGGLITVDDVSSAPITATNSKHS